jgi:hypothetical protein
MVPLWTEVTVKVVVLIDPVKIADDGALMNQV